MRAGNFEMDLRGHLIGWVSNEKDDSLPKKFRFTNGRRVMSLHHIETAIDDGWTSKSKLFHHLLQMLIWASGNAQDIICEPSQESISTSWSAGEYDDILERSNFFSDVKEW